MSLSRRAILSTAAVGIATVAAANAQTPNAPDPAPVLCFRYKGRKAS